MNILLHLTIETSLSKTLPLARGIRFPSTRLVIQINEWVGFQDHFSSITFILAPTPTPPQEFISTTPRVNPKSPRRELRYAIADSENQCLQMYSIWHLTPIHSGNICKASTSSSTYKLITLQNRRGGGATLYPKPAFIPTQLGLGITQAIHCEVIQVSALYYAVWFPQTVYSFTWLTWDFRHLIVLMLLSPITRNHSINNACCCARLRIMTGPSIYDLGPVFERLG